MANYPVGLGHTRVSILVTDDAEPEPTVVTIYTVHVVRENRPSLPTFGDHVMCSFMQVSQLISYVGCCVFIRLSLIGFRSRCEVNRRFLDVLPRRPLWSTCDPAVGLRAGTDKMGEQGPCGAPGEQRAY